MLYSKMRHCMLSVKRVTVPLPKAYSSCPINGSNLTNSSPADLVSSYLDMSKYIRELKRQSGNILVPLKVQTDQSELSAAIRNVWKPTCWTDSFTSTTASMLVSSIMAYNRLRSNTARGEELVDSKRQILAGAKRIAQSFKLEEFSANVALTRTECECTDRRGPRIDVVDYHPAPKSADCIGKLVVILPSYDQYLGGELEVTHKGHTKKVVSQGNWVAFTNSCDIKVNPVREGERHLLFYDVYKDGVELADFTVPDVNDSDTDYDSEEYRRHNRIPTLRSELETHGDFDDDDDAEDYSDDTEDTETEAGKKWEPWHDVWIENAVKLLGGEGPASVRKQVLAGVEDELSRRKEIVIALDNRYPEGMVDTTLFKAGDRALYELLSEQYDVQVVAATVRHDRYNRATGALYSEQIVRQALHSPEATGGHCRFKLILPFKFRQEHVLCSDIDYDDNEDTVYIVSGLLVSKKI